MDKVELRFNALIEAQKDGDKRLFAAAKKQIELGIMAAKKGGERRG